MPDILRQCALNFVNESSMVKLQILTMSSKAFAFLPMVLVPTVGVRGGEQGRSEKVMTKVTILHFYLLKLARYDADFDVRDRARFLKGLTAPLAAKKKLETTDEVGEAESAIESDAGDTIQSSIEVAARTIGESTTEEGDADLKGVRLRREQVVHVLFEGKALSSTTLTDYPTQSDPPTSTNPELGSLSLVLGGKLIKGWLDTTLPPWTSSPTPSTTREPPAVPTTTPLQHTSLANLKSFSSSDFTSSPVVLTPNREVPTPTSRGSATPIELESNTTSTQTLQKYKDLDSFLDESDDEVQEVDDSAPEDDEFGGEWDDDEEQDDDEEEDSEEEEESSSEDNDSE